MFWGLFEGVWHVWGTHPRHVNEGMARRLGEPFFVVSHAQRKTAILGGALTKDTQTRTMHKDLHGDETC